MATSKMQRRKPRRASTELGYRQIVTRSGALGFQPDKHGSIVEKNILVPNATPEEREIVHLLIRANAQFLGRGQEYHIGGLGSKGPQKHFGLAFKPSTHAGWRAEHAQAARDVIGPPRRIDASGKMVADEAMAKRVALTIPRGVRFVADELASVLNMVMAPLFDHTIPHIKIAAAFDELAMWVRRHPDASFEEKMSLARRITDSIDDRFGEMVQDNLFWPRALKQAFNAAVVSVGWEYGTLRAFGGAAKDLLHGGDILAPRLDWQDHMSPRVRWLIGATAIYGLENSYYQYFLGSGQFPWDTDTPWQDAFQGGRTGGRTPQGKPERGRMPSVAKDVWNAYELFSGPAMTLAKTGNPLPLGQAGITWGMEKGNPAVQMGHEAITGRDNFGNEIPTPGPKDTTPLWKRAGEYFLRQIDPITLEAYKNRKTGTHIPVWQGVLGISPLGRQYTDPEGVAKAKDFHEAMVRKEAASRELKQQQQLETPDTDKITELTQMISDAKAELASFRTGGLGRAGTREPGGRSGYTRAGNRTIYDRTGSSADDSGGATVLRGPSQSGRQAAAAGSQDDNGIVARGGGSSSGGSRRSSGGRARGGGRGQSSRGRRRVSAVRG